MRNRRKIIIALSVAAVLTVLYWALRPAPVPVSAARATAGHFVEHVEDEGRTRLRNPYVVSAPVMGYMRRVGLEVGDSVAVGDILFQLEPMPAPAMDARSRDQSREMVSAAQARLKTAQAELEARRAERQVAGAEYERNRELHERGFVAAARMDQVRGQRDAARAGERAAEHVVAEARSALQSARLVLAVADGTRTGGELESLAVRSPIAGVVLKRHRCCEGAVGAGEAVLEIGDLSGLEVVVDLLSMDAVRVREDTRVEIDRWGGDTLLEGRVRRIEPAGYTRVSALGVEEQRVPVLVEIASPRSEWAALGDGFRVETRFVLWEGDNVLQVPTSALFRDRDRWAVFVVDGERAQLRHVEPGRRSGLRTQITAGLEAEDLVISHPGDRVVDGVRVDVDIRGTDTR